MRRNYEAMVNFHRRPPAQPEWCPNKVGYANRFIAESYQLVAGSCCSQAKTKNGKSLKHCKTMVFFDTMRIFLPMAALIALQMSLPASAQVNGFALVNQSGAGLSGFAIRRTGTTEWQSLSAGLSNGARTKLGFSDPDCAFDLKANVAGSGEAVWRGVNLCEVSSVTLRRDASGSTWVDYD